MINNNKEVMELLTMASRGDVESQMQASYMFQYGLRVETDPRSSFYWMEKAANQGNMEAKYELAEKYRNGEGVKADIDKAVILCLESAKSGFVKAISAIGNWYASGAITGTPNPRKAFKCYKKAAMHGSAQAFTNLGNCYRDGNGVHKNIKKAISNYAKAIELGDESARLKRAELVAKMGKTKEANDEYAKLEHSKDVYAKEVLANKYINGDGVAKDVAKGMKMLEDVASECPDAYDTIGMMYYSGKGVKKDRPKALKYFLKAANHGSYEGIIHLIECYQDGSCGEVNLKGAVKWYNYLKNAEIEDGYLGLIKCYQEGLGVEKDDEMADELRIELLRLDN